MTAIVATGPVVRLVFPPTDSRVYVVTLPGPLASDVRARYAEFAADHERLGFKPRRSTSGLSSSFAPSPTVTAIRGPRSAPDGLGACCPGRHQRAWPGRPGHCRLLAVQPAGLVAVVNGGSRFFRRMYSR